MDLILKYFPDLTEEQKRQFAALYDLYLDWNSKINVISRKDIENLYEHHVLHSLGIAKVIRFRPGTQIMDLGTGGRLSGNPACHPFPRSTIPSGGQHRKESTRSLRNSQQHRAEKRHLPPCPRRRGKRKFDFVVSRAVMPLTDLLKIIRKNISSKQQNALPNGLICLKGANWETKPCPSRTRLRCGT